MSEPMIESGAGGEPAAGVEAPSPVATPAELAEFYGWYASAADNRVAEPAPDGVEPAIEPVVEPRRWTLEQLESDPAALSEFEQLVDSHLQELVAEAQRAGVLPYAPG